jgi:hypothetical protein
MAIRRDISNQISGMTAGEVDWDKLQYQMLGDVVTSHLETREKQTAWQNVMLEREISRAAGDCSDQEELEMLLRSYSWLYQGVKLGDSECTDFLAKFSYLPSKVELEQMGHSRWQEFSEDLHPNAQADPAEYSLTEEIDEKSVICTACGERLASLDSYCSNCGVER